MKSASPSLAECYHILGVPQGASLDEIKHAYRTKAFALHPDLNPSAGASRQFQQLNEAYVILIRLLDSRSGSRSAFNSASSAGGRTERKGQEAYKEQQERERKAGTGRKLTVKPGKKRNRRNGSGARRSGANGCVVKSNDRKPNVWRVRSRRVRKR